MELISSLKLYPQSILLRFLKNFLSILFFCYSTRMIPALYSNWAPPCHRAIRFPRRRLHCQHKEFLQQRFLKFPRAHLTTDEGWVGIACRGRPWQKRLMNVGKCWGHRWSPLLLCQCKGSHLHLVKSVVSFHFSQCRNLFFILMWLLFWNVNICFHYLIFIFNPFQ